MFMLLHDIKKNLSSYLIHIKYHMRIIQPVYNNKNKRFTVPIVIITNRCILTSRINTVFETNVPMCYRKFEYLIILFGFWIFTFSFCTSIVGYVYIIFLFPLSMLNSMNSKWHYIIFCIRSGKNETFRWKSLKVHKVTDHKITYSWWHSQTYSKI